MSERARVRARTGEREREIFGGASESRASRGESSRDERRRGASQVRDSSRPRVARLSVFRRNRDSPTLSSSWSLPPPPSSPSRSVDRPSLALIYRWSPVPPATRRGSRPVVVSRSEGEREKETETGSSIRHYSSPSPSPPSLPLPRRCWWWCCRRYYYYWWLLVRFIARVYTCLPAYALAGSVTPGGFDVPRSLRCPMVDRAPQYATRGRSTRRGSHCCCYAIRKYDCGTVKLLRGSATGRELVAAVSSSSSAITSSVVEELRATATANVVATAPTRTTTVVF